jgi:TRAP-type C4-dicarboxylate transport system permease small subunit
MISEPKRSRSPAGYSGLLENLVALARALADFFESRFALLAQESRVALVQLLVLAICLIVASVLVVFGYIFLIISAIVGLAHLAGISWLWITLAAAGVHFVIALVLLLIARRRITKPQVPETTSEIKIDLKCLKNLDEKSQPTS